MGALGSGAAATLVEGEEYVVSHAGPLARGDTIGRYVILGELGRGGMGEVFAAYDPELDRKLAIKILKRSRRDSARSQARMMREAQALAKLSHRNVVAIHDVGTYEERVFVAMEFVAGRTLRDWLEEERPGWREALPVLVQAGEGLVAAHDKGVVHRDFKPDNVMVGDDGVVRVLDFGLAHARDAPASVDPEDTGSSDAPDELLRSSTLDAQLTRDGAVLGTPAYMSPEQHMGQATDAGTDQFSFCVTVYEAFYGEPPFEGETQATRAYAVTMGDVKPPPRASGVPTWLRKVLLRGLAVKPADRYPNMQALLAALQADPAIARRRWMMAGGVGLIVGGLALGVASVSHQEAASCRLPDDALADVWDDASRERVERAFNAVNRPYAQRAFEVTADLIDRYVDGWKQMRVSNCEATRVRGEQSEEAFDLRVRCLDRRRDELAALVGVLAEADDAVVENSITAAVSLPRLEGCADVVALRARVPLPSDPSVRAQVERIEQEVAQVRALTEAGRYPEAAELARQAAEGARGTGYRPVEAEAMGALGRALEFDGHPDEARAALLDAEVAAEVSGDDETLADVRLALALVAGDRLARPREGHLWVSLARGSLERIGDDPRRTAVLEDALGRVYEAEENLPAELEHKLRALEILEEIEAPAAQQAGLHNAVSAILAQLGRSDEALEHAEQGVRMATEALGADHPQVAVQIGGLALVHDYAGRYAEALPHYRKAIAILEAALGRDHPRLAEVVNNYAIAQINNGDYPGGEKAFRRVLELRRGALGEDHPDIAQGLGNLAGILRMQGHNDEARQTLARALEMQRKILEPGHRDIASSLAALANVYEDLGDYPSAIDSRTQALEIYERVYGPESPELLVELGNLAYGYARNGERAPAIEAAERAVGIAGRHEGLQPDVVGFVHVAMARALSTKGRRDPAALGYAEKALQILGDDPAPWERKLLSELATELGWDDPRFAQAATPD
jgi:tetratricopeptide (TPR) repeat protein/predicted Ser/Thr protein kinase